MRPAREWAEEMFSDGLPCEGLTVGFAADLIARAQAEARQEEREANIKAVCWHCREGYPLTMLPDDPRGKLAYHTFACSS